MKNYYYDLHIHSCLSPCGDDAMTPSDIAGMACVKGLDIVALTDHNSVKNCPAFFEACNALGIIPVAGMELTTAEDIHIVCLFPRLASALAFGDYVETRRIRIKNREDIFGRQLVMNADDVIISQEEHLLPNATQMPIDEAVYQARRFGALAYPAHIDRESNGIIATLGMLPETPFFTAVEYKDIGKKPEYDAIYNLSYKKTVCSSDAHYLWDINEKEHFITLDGEKETAVCRLLEYLAT